MAHGLAQKLAAKALLETGQSLRQVSKQLKVSHNSVSAWRDNPEFDLLPKEKVDQIKRTLVGKTYNNAWRAQNHITDEKLKESTALQLMTISAIGIDKARLMENLSTENVSFRGVAENIESSRKNIMEKLNALGISDGNTP